MLSVQNGVATVEQRNKFSLHDTLEVVSPACVGVSFPITSIRDESGQEILTANRVRQILRIPVPDTVRPGDFLRVRIPRQETDL